MKNRDDTKRFDPELDAVDQAILSASREDLEAEYREVGEDPAAAIAWARSRISDAMREHRERGIGSTDQPQADMHSVRGNDRALGVGDRVRLVGDALAEGRYVDTTLVAGHRLARVQFPSGIRRIPFDQIELVPEAPEEPIELLRKGKLGSPERLRQVLTHARLTGRLADVLYSMESTNTEFHAHQFKPVLKMLSSPTGGLLIADEVGLGKTIEAGLIWTELKARYEYRRLLVVCPRDLLRKWEAELTGKFGLDARVLTPSELLTVLKDPVRSSRGFVAICSLQALQPPSDWEDEEGSGFNRSAAQLARFLRDQADEEPIFDMLVIDEVHHLRNPETQRNQLGRLLRPLAHHKVFLSATPIHLRNRDLFSLLSLLDPETFRYETVLQQILEANQPLVAAREAALRGAPKAEILSSVSRAAAHPLLAGTSQVANLTGELEASAEPLSFAERSRIAGRLEQVNLLANLVNRTRRRDVQELRVVRNVTAYRAQMTELERTVYDRVTDQIEQYARRSGTGAGFLLSMPQRLLASSIPASMEHWRARLPDLEIEDDDEDLGEGNNHNDLRSLTDQIADLCRNLPSPDELANDDTKFAAFYDVVGEFLRNNPSEKVVVFSTFRATLRYLDRRLRASGYEPQLLHGEIADRDGALDRFEREPNVRILLASEIGSEGLDLQFCRAIVNYDLPWNPMRVEQRIGRIDRIGQTAESVSVFNLLYADTIDERIYARLYERLDLCRRALGDFEAVLGDEIRKLTADLLSGRLSPEQQLARIEQTSQAIENNHRETADLEAEAAALIAHGDHVLQSIRATHDMNRWIGASELARYLSDSLATLYPGAGIRDLGTDSMYEIRLPPDARAAYSEWLLEKRLPQGARLEREYGPVLCQFGRPAPRIRHGRFEAITQSHPFTRFVASRLAVTEAPRLRPAVAVRLKRERFLDGPIDPGRYAGLAVIWSFGGQVEQERIAYAAMRLDDQAILAEDIAEKLIVAAAENGSHWVEADTAVDFQTAAATSEAILVQNLMERFLGESAARTAEQSDRAAIQLRTLELRFGEEEQRLIDSIERQRRGSGRLVAANEERLRRLRQRAADRRAQIERSARQTAQSEQLAVVLAEVI